MTYADDLNKGGKGQEFYLRQISDQSTESEVLLQLMERIRQTLVPVQPSPTFVKDLARQLVVNENGMAKHPMQDHWREIFIGVAAVGSALSFIGLVAYLLRNRMQVKTPVASIG